MKTFLYKLSLLWIFCRLYIIQIESFTKSQSEPIISGKRAEIGQFPWHVLLRRDEEDILLCGGSLISNQWVLTAAHCLDNLTSVFLAFGSINLYIDNITMISTELFIHPDYNAKNVTDDLALIKLPTLLNYSDYIKSIDLVSPAQASNDFVGVEGILTGFGQRSNIPFDFSEWLLWASLEVISNADCAHAYRRPSIANEEMCTIGYNQTDMSPCDCDSGGALVWKNDFDKFVQIGVTSFSVANKCTEFPAGYARVTSYLDYIHNITGLNFD